MTPEVMAQAFDPFFTTKENDQGAGLGLSTVYGIIKQSGGYVTGESIPGTGTKWSLWLPAGQVQAPAPLAAPALASTGVRVLLVEDEEAVRSMLTEWLVRDHIAVTAVASAEEAIEAHAAGEFDVLVTDVGLPRVSGPALAKTIQARSPGIRVILISGYVADSLGRTDIDSGAIFLQKPFSPRELARRVRELVPRPIPQD